MFDHGTQRSASAATEANDRRMRPGGNNNNRRGRNRGPRKPHGGMPNKSQNFDNGGAETRVRGNVYQVLEKYLQLARDAGVAGDRVAAENFLQHADHYYRVIQAMNDGQRPRIGGRDISVADVNVQNVSQGLSAALYSGGPSQPSMSENAGNQGQVQGNGAARGNDNFNGQGSNAQGNSGQNDDAHGDDAHGDDAQAGNAQGDDGQNDGGQNENSYRREGGNYQRQQQSQGRDRQRQRREFRENRSDNRDGRQNDGRQNEVRQGEGRQNEGRQEESRDRGNQQPVVTEQNVSAPVARVADEQPDYPEHLLPAAVETPSQAIQGPRAPRGRPRRPRAAEGDGEAVPATPVADVSE